MLPIDGKITMQDIATEINLPPNSQLTLDDPQVRSIAFKPNGMISLDDCHGKEDFPTLSVFYTPFTKSQDEVIHISSDYPCESYAIFISNADDVPMSFMPTYDEYYTGPTSLADATEEDKKAYKIKIPMRSLLKEDAIKNGVVLYVDDKSGEEVIHRFTPDESGYIEDYVEIYTNVVVLSGTYSNLPPHFEEADPDNLETFKLMYSTSLYLIDNVSTSNAGDFPEDSLDFLNHEFLKNMGKEVTGKDNVSAVVIFGQSSYVVPDNGPKTTIARRCMENVDFTPYLQMVGYAGLKIPVPIRFDDPDFFGLFDANNPTVDESQG